MRLDQRRRQFILAVIAVCAPLLVAAADGPARRFSATAVVDGPQGTRRLPLTIDVSRYTSPEEARQLRKVLETAGQTAAAATLENRLDGHLELGGLRLPLALAVAAEGEDGWHYVFVSPRRLRVDGLNADTDPQGYPFGMALLHAPSVGAATGELHIAAALRIADDGWLEVIDHAAVESRFEDVRVER